jgi:hypothetical protein
MYGRPTSGGQSVLNPSQSLFTYISDLDKKLREVENDLCDKRDVIELARKNVEEARKDVKEANKKAETLQIEKVSCFNFQSLHVN